MVKNIFQCKYNEYKQFIRSNIFSKVTHQPQCGYLPVHKENYYFNHQRRQGELLPRQGESTIKLLRLKSPQTPPVVFPPLELLGSAHAFITSQ